jgi:hypothetical protein
MIWIVLLLLVSIKYDACSILNFNFFLRYIYNDQLIFTLHMRATVYGYNKYSKLYIIYKM